ncbi:MAG TPA: helix-turn-helix transcriptional regulator [Tepidisphaeraceae bacterium]|jgi:transcriptional regulator with XRE-family HTH domain
MPLNVPEIKRKRERLGITQTEAARRAGFSIQRWNNIEAGRRTAVNPDALFALAKALECRMEDLMRRHK